MKEKNFILRCNGMKKTGGPMATLQLAECLASFGAKVRLWYDSIEAYTYFQDWHIRYLGCDPQYTTTDKINDYENQIIILTETSFNDIEKIPLNNKIWVYMQSVDNCIIFGTTASRIEGTIRILKNCFKNFSMAYENRWGIVQKRIEFIFSQSAYSNNFLSKLDANIPYLYIGDFIDKGIYKKKNKEDLYINTNKLRIVYNPSKGKILYKLSRLFSRNIEFIPIQGVKPDDILHFLSIADCYVDFGGQPGKDRLPREAILSGIPAFQFSRGAAVNGSDFPCPVNFRLNLFNCINFEAKIRKGIKLNNKAIHASRLSEILAEKANFYERVKNYLDTYFGNLESS